MDEDHLHDPSKRRKLVGFDNFKRLNPKTDKFESKRFHHIEFWCGDANNTSRRFQWGFGLQLIAKSDQSTGNHTYASYVLKSGELIFTFTSAYSREDKVATIDPLPHNKDEIHSFFAKHGLAVRAIGVTVDDATAAYNAVTANGARGTHKPFEIHDKFGKQTIAEWNIYGDVQMRFISGDYKGPYLAGYEAVESPGEFVSYGLKRIDHCVGNVPKLIEAVNYIGKATGFHEFAEFTAADVGTVDSGLNSMVMASNNEMILLPINEPTYGTKRKSQIQTYLEQNEGAGLQHLALKCDDIFHTLGEMRKRTLVGGFDFMPHPGKDYYKRLPSRVGDSLTAEEIKKCDELGILVDKDDQGVLLQIFTKPVGDRPTLFCEIIERRGCEAFDAKGHPVEQVGGCGGFGKGNFAELFKSIEEYEKTLDSKVVSK